MNFNLIKEWKIVPGCSDINTLKAYVDKNPRNDLPILSNTQIPFIYNYSRNPINIEFNGYSNVVKPQIQNMDNNDPNKVHVTQNLIQNPNYKIGTEGIMSTETPNVQVFDQNSLENKIKIGQRYYNIQKWKKPEIHGFSSDTKYSNLAYREDRNIIGNIGINKFDNGITLDNPNPLHQKNIIYNK